MFIVRFALTVFVVVVIDRWIDSKIVLMAEANKLALIDAMKVARKEIK
jgi:hypothetical protein